MKNTTEHICVCVCTYKRPHLLRRLLDGLGKQITDGLFNYSIVVVDNDHLRSSEAEVSDFAASSPVPSRYFVEPEQGIPKARNRAVANANGDFVAFIDDDEFPTENWLLTLLSACKKYDADGVLGPVYSHFDGDPPKWIVKGKFWDRPTYPTGRLIEGRMGRTGNVLLKKSIFAANKEPFQPELQTGEDQEFFLKMVEKGHVFVWCNEAVAYEVVPPERWKRWFILRRSLFQGSFSPLHCTFGVGDFVKSVIAIPVYTAILPFVAILGHHRFMSFLAKVAYHVGAVLVCLNIKVIKEPYVTH
jgi:glycosyltransferase involved in cell wall biosynthesis